MDTIEYITQEKKELLEAELHDLKTVKRKEVLEALDFAKSLGDLSENAEYHQAREDQGKLEERIAKIENILKNAEIVVRHHSDVVEIGTIVTVRKEGTKDLKTFQIVGSEEADMASGKISMRSPIGVALFGHKKGDKVSFQSPIGEVEYKIIEIE